MTDIQEEQLFSKIKEIIENKNNKQAYSLIDEIPNADIADTLGEFSKEEQIAFLRLLKTEDAADVFSFLETEQQKELALDFNEEWSMKMLQELQSDELADVLEELPANVTSKIIAYTPQDKRNEINKILSYADDEVGSIMSIDISFIQNTYTCEQALYKIKKDYSKNRAELVHYYYVVDATQKLLGVLTLEEIIFAKSSDKIDNIYSPVTSIMASDKQEDAAKIFSEHDMSVLPVINQDKRLIGMITSDDVIDVIHDAATDDLYKMAGISSKGSEADDYLKTPWYKLLKHRILWGVIILLFSTILEIAGFFLFKEVFRELQTTVISISLFLSFLVFITTINTVARNGSTQTNITIKRVLTMDIVETKHFRKVILKETIVGLMLGLSLALINVGRLSIFLASTGDLLNKAKASWAIIIGSSFSLLIAMTLLSFISALIPILYVKHHKDPSNSSLVMLNAFAELITSLIVFGVTIGFLNIFIH
ncbi:magnesium transporter [Mycoplasma zalophidermidis]|uniref:Magnesium transporter MgtE n=1 Tax=Mycoplasma zalophidermidis TaxID=398174 RepID=A0ABS6DRV0_9MOLU|nr:magnesium transporter [Mycoplasma zalophidermidis]MBU4689744.1 magnesium transporter [Mycoplasma zalophidermidis]MBU4693744.1 magnesium transporter [Mycoplasma zalophidermidis]MCR8966625.1 magnesium transporter [Mycoplasma zalophidermidis]